MSEVTLQPFFAKGVSNLYSFYLFSVGEPAEYIEWFEGIRQATENDVIRIHINSPGGNLNTTTQLLKCIQETPATVIASVEGECMSAATMVFLSCDYAEIADHSMFMFHNYSGGVIGKGGEMMDQLKYERAWSKNLLSDVYKDFLTDEEIESMLSNRDIWMTGEEVTDRLKQRAEKLKIQLKDEVDDTDI